MAKASKTRPIKYADKSAGQPELAALFQTLRKTLSPYAKGNYIVKEDRPGSYSVYYGKEIEVRGKKYPELCFAALLVQKGYVGFYYFPVYMDVRLKLKLPPALLQCLKGKTCFYIKKNDPDLLNQIRDALKTGYAFYELQGWK